jgi:hypothetical protein
LAHEWEADGCCALEISLAVSLEVRHRSTRNAGKSHLFLMSVHRGDHLFRIEEWGTHET